MRARSELAVVVVVSGAVATAALWASDRLDDYVGWAPAVAIAQGLFLWGAAGAETLGGWRRAALVLACTFALVAPAFNVTPWVLAGFGTGDGLSDLGLVVFMLMIVLPAAALIELIALWRWLSPPTVRAARRGLTAVAIGTALAWLLALGHVIAHGTAAPGLLEVCLAAAASTWWLVVPLWQHVARERSA